MALYIKNITINDAVDIICSTAGLKHFQITPESQKEMDDLVIAYELKRAVLIAVKPDVEVSAREGSVIIKTTAHESQEV